MAVQQLDKSMSNLRTWLSRVEAELAEPLVYQVCHAHEIQRKLAEQQVQFQLRSGQRKAKERSLHSELRIGKERETGGGLQLRAQTVFWRQEVGLFLPG